MEIGTAPPFQLLLDEHAADVLRFLRAMVGRVDADDCFQETFLAALRAYPRLRRHDDLRSWLFTIARNKATDHHRASGRRPVPLPQLPERGEPAADGDPFGEDVWRVVAQLPPKQRAAIALRYAADLSYGELAGALECSEDAARRNVHEGLKKLRLSAGAVRAASTAAGKE